MSNPTLIINRELMRICKSKYAVVLLSALVQTSLEVVEGSRKDLSDLTMGLINPNDILKYLLMLYKQNYIDFYIYSIRHRGAKSWAGSLEVVQRNDATFLSFYKEIDGDFREILYPVSDISQMTLMHLDDGDCVIDMQDRLVVDVNEYSIKKAFRKKDEIGRIKGGDK